MYLDQRKRRFYKFEDGTCKDSFADVPWIQLLGLWYGCTHINNEHSRRISLTGAFSAPCSSMWVRVKNCLSLTMVVFAYRCILLKLLQLYNFRLIVKEKGRKGKNMFLENSTEIRSWVLSLNHQEVAKGCQRKVLRSGLCPASMTTSVFINLTSACL